MYSLRAGGRVVTANPKAVSVNIQPSSGGQTAHDLRIGPQPEYVDQTRSHLNRVMIEPLRNNELRDEWQAVKKVVGKTGKIRSNQNLAYAGVVTFGIEAQTIFAALSDEEQEAALRELCEKIATRFNTRLTGLVIHLDESALHAHFQLRGIADDGTMLSQTVKRAALREVQTLAAEVMGKHAPGIERGKTIQTRLDEGEDYAATIRRSVKQLHADLPEEIAAKEGELAEVQAKLDKNAALLTKAQADLEKAVAQNGAESAKAEKIRKRAATYEKRATDAQTQLDRLTGELAHQQAALDKIEKAKGTAKGELDQLKGQQVEARADLAAKSSELDGLKSAVAQKKTNIETLRAKKAALQARLQSLSAP